MGNKSSNLHDKYCVHQLFAQQVARTPDATAVVYKDTRLSYQEFDSRANDLALCLRAQGVKPGALVGLFLERSLEAMVGMLAILKVGGAYVPLDPAYPKERLSYLLDDTGIRTVLTVSSLSERLDHPEVSLLCMDKSETPTGEIKLPEGFDFGTNPDSLCYVMFTSGSTGRPKGVMVPHRGVVRLVKDNHFCEMDANQVHLQLVPLSFDVCTFEIWAPLLNGGTLVVMPSHTPSLQEIGTVIQTEGVNTLWLTAGLFHAMVDYNLEGLRPIKQLLAGGDIVSPSHARKVIQAFPHCRMINGYGPTEATCFAVCHDITLEDTYGASVPIGKAIAHDESYILDPDMRQVPVGVEGELYLGGAGLADGYLNQPELTAERFVPHPFSTEPGAKLYRTGDRARWRADGVIEFFGRLDHQVKIRGFRIEPGEVEQELLSHPMVEKAVVIPVELGTSKELFGYVVLDSSATGISGNLLRQYLAERLPEHAVPVQILLRTEIPLTLNGKIDRRALAQETTIRERPELPVPYVAPAGALEEALATCWQNVLRLAIVGANDNVFELGAKSIDVIQVHQELSRLVSSNPEIALFFQYPTVRSLVKHLDTAVKGAPNGVPPGVAPSRETTIQDRARLQREALRRMKDRR